MTGPAALGDGGVSVCVPARDEAACLARVVAPLVELHRRGDIVQILVVDDDSRDGTGDVARSLGAETCRTSSLLPTLGPSRGKGDALWRAQALLRGDIVCFFDGDLENFDPSFVETLARPLRDAPEVHLCKGAFSRPYREADGTVHPNEGGRVTELTARPLLRTWFPELADLAQPLSGQFAARRSVLAEIDFLTGYAVDVHLLLATYRRCGRAAIVERDLGEILNPHQTLSSLRAVADDVVEAISMHVAEVHAPSGTRPSLRGVIRREPMAAACPAQSGTR